jgi:hypothetical protein
MLSAEENVSISIVLPAVAALLDNTPINDDDVETVRSFKEELHEQLTNRFKLDIKRRDAVTVLPKSTFLDPRFAHMSFVTCSTKALVIDELRKELSEIRPTATETGAELNAAAQCK